MMKPLFAAGRRLERSLAYSENAGNTLLHIAQPGDFAVGAPILISDSDDSRPEYLGAVRAVEVDGIRVGRALAIDRAVTSRLWSPASAFAWETVSSATVRDYRAGVAAERSAGGAVWSVRTAAGAREDEMRFEGLSSRTVDAFRLWVDTAARGGLDDFTRIDEYGAIARVRLLDCDIALREEPPRTAALVLHLAVLEEGNYA